MQSVQFSFTPPKIVGDSVPWLEGDPSGSGRWFPPAVSPHALPSIAASDPGAMQGAAQEADVLGLTFVTLDGVRGGPSRASVDYLPFLQNHACYFHGQGLPYAIVVINDTDTSSSSVIKHPTLLKPRVVQEALRWWGGGRWVLYLDADLVVLRANWTLSQTYELRGRSRRFDLILNDHNTALNNGAFFVRDSPGSHELLERWRGLSEARLPPFRSAWPFTDQGAMLEALLQLADPEAVPSQCSSGPLLPDAAFSSCVSSAVEALSGQEFDGLTARSLDTPRLLLWPPATAGFNNHVCRRPVPEWGWDARACYDERSSFMVHTKAFRDPPPHLHPPPRTCPPATHMQRRHWRPGLLLVLPGLDRPCYLDEEECVRLLQRQPEEEEEVEEAVAKGGRVVAVGPDDDQR